MGNYQKTMDQSLSIHCKNIETSTTEMSENLNCMFPEITNDISVRRTEDRQNLRHQKDFLVFSWQGQCSRQMQAKGSRQQF